METAHIKKVWLVLIESFPVTFTSATIAVINLSVDSVTIWDRCASLSRKIDAYIFMEDILRDQEALRVHTSGF